MPTVGPLDELTYFGRLQRYCWILHSFISREPKLKMHRRAHHLQLSIALSALLAATPYTLKVSDFDCSIVPQTVVAKDGNNGNGGGNSGGNGNGGGNGNQSGSKSEAQGKQSAKEKSVTDANRAGLAVRHRDGITEALSNGRYSMKDSKGRTIINRRATIADEMRLRFLQ